jgi:hypothetical protein
VSLGNAFPDEFRRKQVEHCLVAGAVLYLEVVFPEVTKNKFLVLVSSSDDKFLNFIVNSETNSYIQARPHLNVCQVTLKSADHDFLAYDSKIACHDVLPIPKTQIIDALMADFGRYKGRISSVAKDDVVSAVKHAVTLSRVLQRNIIAGLDSQYPGE